MSTLDEANWPTPLVAYLSGKLSRSDLDAAVEAGGEAHARNRECEMKFFLTAARERADMPDEFHKAMEEVKKLCPVQYIEYKSAMLELER